VQPERPKRHLSCRELLRRDVGVGKDHHPGEASSAFFCSWARSRRIVRRAFLGSVGKLVVIVGELEHQCSRFKVFHFAGEHAHFGRTIAPVLCIICPLDGHGIRIKQASKNTPRSASVGFPSYRITMLLQGVTPAGPRQYRTVTPLPRSSTAAGHHEIRPESFRTPIVKRKVVRQAQAFAFRRRTQSNVRRKQRDRSPRGLQARLRGGLLDFEPMRRPIPAIL